MEIMAELLCEQFAEIQLAQNVVLDKSSENVNLLNNNQNQINNQLLQNLVKRSQTFLNLNLFRKSLLCSESILSLISDWTIEDNSVDVDKTELRLRGVDLKGKALLGLGQYEDALIFLGKETSSLKTFDINLPSAQSQIYKRHLLHWKHLMERAKVLQRVRITGDINMGDFLPNRKVRLDVDYVTEYQDVRIQIGAIIPGKGRGVLALDDIPKGSLILGTRAFEIIFDTEDEDDDLENSIAQRLQLDPTLIPEVYSLHAGKELGYFPNQYNNNNSDPSEIDIKRIAGICTMNSFGNSRNSNGYGHNSRGLWLRASFFNHDCLDFNSMWKVLGDFLFVRTIQDVKKGEELLIAYTDTAEVFEERDKFFKAHDFSCACRLCQYQSGEDPKIRSRRLEILQQLNLLDEKDRKDCSTQDLDIEIVETYLKELEILGRDRPAWNFSPHVALDLLTKLYLRKGDSAKYKEMAGRYYVVVNCGGAAAEMRVHALDDMTILKEHREKGPCLEVGAAGQVAAVFLKAGDLLGAKQWITILRQDLSLVYGKEKNNGDGFDVFKKLYPQLYAQAVKYGIISDTKK